MEEAKILDLIHRVQHVPISMTLWSADSCAKFLELDKQNFVKNIASRADFPPHVTIPTGNIRGTKRWKAKDVMRWVDSLEDAS